VVLGAGGVELAVTVDSAPTVESGVPHRAGGRAPSGPRRAAACRRPPPHRTCDRAEAAPEHLSRH
jgi:hypothetical protein